MREWPKGAGDAMESGEKRRSPEKDAGIDRSRLVEVGAGFKHRRCGHCTELKGRAIAEELSGASDEAADDGNLGRPRRTRSDLETGASMIEGRDRVRGGSPAHKCRDLALVVAVGEPRLVSFFQGRDDGGKF